MTRTLRHLVTGLAATGILALLVVGIPTLLIGQVGWPLPTRWPDLDTLRWTLTAGGMSHTVVVNTLAIVVWVAWLQVTVAVLAELTAAVRGRAADRLPLAPGVQAFATRLVAASLLAVTTLQPRPLLRPTAADGGRRTVDVRRTVTGGRRCVGVSHGPDSPSAVQERPTVTITTAERDSLWRLAETHLGDGPRGARSATSTSTGRSTRPPASPPPPNSSNRAGSSSCPQTTVDPTPPPPLAARPDHRRLTRRLRLVKSAFHGG
jgi:hypothetical protein